MAKPTPLPVFDSNDTNTVQPVSGRQTDGWATNDIPTAANFNWLFRRIYLWLKWLDDGLWVASSLVLSGGSGAGYLQATTLYITGNTAIDGDLTVGGTTTFAAPASTTPTLGTGVSRFLNVPTGLDPGYWKDAFGVVHLQGTCYHASSANYNVFASALPAGFRPSAAVLFGNRAADYGSTYGAIVTILADGTVNVQTSAANKAVTLDGITFR